MFAGSGSQQFFPDLNQTVNGRSIELNKPGGRVLLDGRLVVPDRLILTDGILETVNGGLVHFKDGAIVLSVSDSSYVEGPVKKVGNDAFTFPVGSNGHYRPIGISAPSSTSDAYTAEHRNENSDSTYTHGSRDSTINEIGTNEYWLLGRTTGTSDITVTLSWDDMSCGFDTLANLRMAAWGDTVWKDLGNGGTTGDSLVGTMQSNGVSTVYGAYALATVDTFDCVPCRAYAGEDRIIYAGWIIRLGQDDDAELSYLWAPDYNIDNATASNPLVNPKYELEYKLQTTNAGGCVAKDDVHIEVRTPVRLNHNCVVN